MTTTFDADRAIRSRQAALLAFVAGYVDAYALIHYRVFASFMSGNTTQTGLSAGQGQWELAGHNFLPIPAFVCGVIVGTILSEIRGRWTVRGLWIGAAALLLISATSEHFVSGAAWCNIIMLSLAMGILNTTVTQVGGQTVSLGFVTGDLNNLGRHVAFALSGKPLTDSQAQSDTRGRRAFALAAVWGFFLLGAALAGAGSNFLGQWLLAPPIAALGVLTMSEDGRR